MFASIVIENKNQTAKAGDKIELNVYACPVDGAPIQLNSDQFNVTGEAAPYANGTLTVKAAGDVTVTCKLNTNRTDKMTITLAR